MPLTSSAAWAALLLAAVSMSLPVICQAQDAATSARDEEARSLFEAGRTAFEAGRYEAALRRFREAHELSGRDELLFNIATAADRMRHDDEALEAYSAYLASDPTGPQVQIARERVAFLSDRVAEDPQPPPQAETTSSENAEPIVSSEAPSDGGGGSIVEEWWFWTLIGVLVVGAGVGIGVGVAVGSGGQPEEPLPGSVGGVIFTLGGT